MKQWTRFFAPARNIDSLVAAIIGFCIIQILAKHSGIGVSPDSVTYISAARSFHAGRGLVQFDGVPIIVFPVFYPVFLSIISYFSRLDPLVYGPTVNGLLFGILLYFCGSVMNGFHTKSRWYKWIILSCLTISPSLVEIYSMFWSETLYILLLLFFIASFSYYAQTYSIRALVLSSCFVALACVTRYAGIAFLCTGGFMLLIDNRIRLGKKMWHLIIYNILSCSLLVINLLRNRALSGTFTGVRQKGTSSLFDNMRYFGNILCYWLPFPKNNVLLDILITVCCLIVGVLLFIIMAKRSGFHSVETISAGFCVIYCLFMLFSATLSRYEQFSNRLVSPLFIPLVWTISYWMPFRIRQFRGLAKYLLLGSCLLCFAAFQYNQVDIDYETYDGVKDAGIPGYTEDPFPQTQIVQFIKKNKYQLGNSGNIFSNAGDAVYFFTGLNAQLIPQKVFPADATKYYSEKRDYLIWFDDIDNPDLLGLKEILIHKNMKLIKAFNDGAVYMQADLAKSQNQPAFSD